TRFSRDWSSDVCSSDLSDLLAPYRSVWPNVIVGYNRRFYAAVAAAKAFIDRQDSCMVHMQLPDSVPPPGTGADREHNVRSNSVHGFDLLRHLVGDVAVKHIASLGDPRDYRGRLVTLESTRGDVCAITANWNSPSNF